MSALAVHRTGEFNGHNVDYTFSLELVPVLDQLGTQIADVSVHSYVADGADERRPIVFAFNGGPNVAAAPLQLSGIGPERAVVPPLQPRTLLHDYAVESSPESILDVADLVFIDPVNTGFGRPADDVPMERFYSIQGDADYFASVVRAWVSRHQRWGAPRFLLGESYGTLRAAFMTTAMSGLAGSPVSGVILLGQAVNAQEAMERPGSVPGALASLPYLAATAWFHGRGSSTSRSAEEAVTEALRYATHTLGSVLHQGSSLPADVLEKTAVELEQLTGVPAPVWIKNRLWLTKTEFNRILLQETGQSLGGFDSRYASPTEEGRLGELLIDPSVGPLIAPYSLGIERHLRRAFGEDVATLAGRTYRFEDSAAVAAWDWSDAASAQFEIFGQPSPFHVYPYPARLSRWMREDPDNRLFIGTGIYDSLTTIGAAEHLLRQYDLPAERVTSRWYNAGHMMYTDPEARRALTDDLRNFVAP